MEIRKGFDKLCVDGVLKDEYTIFETKGLTCALEFPTVVKMEWIKLVLSRIHDGSL